MPNIKLIGRKTNFYGKTFWEIVGNLKDYGVGRLVTTGTYLESYKEPCYFKIVKVIPEPDVPEPSYDVHRKVIIWMERVFRGNKIPVLVELFRTSYKPDFRLIPKDEEHIWINSAAQCKRRERTISAKSTLPPLLKLFIKRQMEKNGENVTEEDLMMPVVFHQKRENIVRLAKEGEEPDIKCDGSFGTPATPSLYENIEATREHFTRERRFVAGEAII